MQQQQQQQQQQRMKKQRGLITGDSFWKFFCVAMEVGPFSLMAISTRELTCDFRRRRMLLRWWF
jgi:hypothetical protein